MIEIWKSDLYRFGKSKLFYGIMAFTGLLAFALTQLIRQDIRLGISVFGNLTAFKELDDIIRIGVQYQKGLGILVAVLMSVFIGQEYLWKTWQHKWIARKSRNFIYLSKTLLSSAVSVMIFLLFETVALFCSGQIQKVFTSGYLSMMICGSFVYAALGAVISMFSMLIKNNTTSTLVCLGYILFSETLATVIQNICGLSDITAKAGNWIISSSVYGMSLRISGVVSPENILPIFVNVVVIIGISTAIGLTLFSKYEL